MAYNKQWVLQAVPDKQEGSITNESSSTYKQSKDVLFVTHNGLCFAEAGKSRAVADKGMEQEAYESAQASTEQTCQLCVSRTLDFISLIVPDEDTTLPSFV